MNELALFAGAGGGVLGGHLLGWRCVCAVEVDAFARSILLARQNDGTLAPFPVWDDVRTFDGRPWRGVVDVVSGGFPCQDISAAAGDKATGIDGDRSGLWSEMARIVGEVRPSYVVVENSPILTSRGLGRVLGDLARLGFDADWGVLGAHNTGAPHLRDRLWLVAHAVSERHLGQGTIAAAARNEKRDVQAYWRGRDALADAPQPGREAAKPWGYWATEPPVGGLAHGVAHRPHRLKAAGNGQVPAVDALAWRVLTGGAP